MSEYLAIKNWQKFQALRRSGKWIKDYTGQNDEPELAKLTMFERGVLQECRRIRGRTGKSIPYDLTFIARAMHTVATDCPHIGHAIGTLISRGLLVVTNQQHDSLNSIEIEKEKEIEKESKPSTRRARGLKPTDPRFHHCVDILHRYWDKFVRPQIKSFQLWFGDSGGKQLKNSLNRHEALTVEDFTRCVANRARSPGVNHAQPAYEWLGHVLDWAGGPKGAANGHANYKTAAAGRNSRNVAALLRSGVAESVQNNHVPDGGTVRDGTGNRAAERRDGGIANDQVLAGKPQVIKPVSDA